ncbi:MAG: bifunctional hydroxymethylpyrimidine kinase/phosphomethylpyrimidine kinase [Acidobacteria bacterium]|nr:bifunctional hydroxymethylpyrimidine kinase/phosphomethylpyrimidine kinase [Acidobacteriota bacterium]
MVPPTAHSPVALTIAGHDPSSGAGITADLATFAAHGVFGASCITALTVQSTLGVAKIQPILGGYLHESLDFLAKDIPISGVKIGMLGSEENVRAVADFLQTLPPGTPIVLDPVLVSSSGRELLDQNGISAMRSSLLPHVSWITPNRSELGALLNGADCNSREQIEQSARKLDAEYPRLGIVVTGGDADTPDDFVLPPQAERGNWLPGEHIQSNATHGTGCAFSSAMLCALMQGQTGLEAATSAKHYVTEAVRRAPRIGQGKGPMHLLWPLR